MEYKPDYNNKDNVAYKDLESRIIPILQKQYGGIKGFLSVFVTGFRKGSVIIDFTVKTSQIDGTEMTEANKNLTGALREIAPVIESAVAQYYSPTNLVPSAAITYTGQTMMLTCGPPDFNIGTISQTVWKFKDLPINSIRFKSSSDGNQSTLTVSNAILSDAGLYTCILMGEYVYFHQNKTLSQENIRAAPVVQVKSEIPVKCQVKKIQSLECCVQSPFTVKWYNSSVALLSDSVGGKNCTKYNYKMESCNTPTTKTFTCKVENISLIYEAKTKLTIFVEDAICKSNKYGDGRIGDKVGIMCGEGLEGHKILQCQEPGEWKLVEDTCIVTIIKELLTQSKDLVNDEVKNFTGDLRTAVMEKQHQISNSSSTISAIVNMLTTIAAVSTEVNKVVMKNVLQTVDFIISDGSKETWISLNSNLTNNSSSELLGSMETISEKLNGTFDIATQNIQLNRTMFSKYFNEELNSTVSIHLEDTALNDVFITTMVFSTLYNVMPTRNSMFNFTYFSTTGNETDNGNAINAAVLLVKLNQTNVNVSLSYKKRNTSLSESPQCVLWKFSLFDKLGAWDNEGCEFVSDINDTVTCNCSYLTSFSILMSTSIPPDKSLALDIITYIGVGISLASLVICLVIEGIVWRALTKNSTAFMRHVSIVNTALSLLIADICFIVSAYVAKNLYDNPNRYKVPIAPCSAVTFFMHFFYLALFFWMLVSGLLLLYRTVMVFSHMSKWIMLALGFLLGYGCPLIIAVITVAVTAPGGGYIREDLACWLNWSETKALLALVIPALTIVVINIFIVIVVLFKMLRRRMGKTLQADENHTLVVIIRCVAILTPLFGLTWSLGIGTMVSPTNDGIHIAFAFFNSLQGFFILVFGTLFDSKIRSLISRLVPTLNSGSNPTKSTTAGISSFSGFKIFQRFCDIYHVSRVANSSKISGASESFNKI